MSKVIRGESPKLIIPSEEQMIHIDRKETQTIANRILSTTEVILVISRKRRNQKLCKGMNKTDRSTKTKLNIVKTVSNTKKKFQKFHHQLYNPT